MSRLPLLAILVSLLAPWAHAAPLRIVATTQMVADAVRAIAGEHAQVQALMGSGVDPHLYKPTRSDIAAIMAADAVFYNGLLLEGRMTDALIRAANAGKPVYAITEHLDHHTLLQPEAFEGHDDPHVWMDPIAWAQTLQAIEARLATLAPDHAEDFASRAQTYREQVLALDTYAQTVLATIPETSRILITAHDAFNYFGRRYQFEVIGIQGMSTASEAGVQDIERIVTTLVTRKVPAVFIESTVAPRNVMALLDGARAQGHNATLGGSLFSDAMGPPGTYEGTYIGMLDHNITTIARALGGSAPEQGMQGKLTSQAP